MCLLPGCHRRGYQEQWLLLCVHSSLWSLSIQAASTHHCKSLQQYRDAYKLCHIFLYKSRTSHSMGGSGREEDGGGRTPPSLKDLLRASLVSCGRNLHDICINQPCIAISA